MGGYTIQKAVWFYFIISSGFLLLNVAKDIKMFEWPPKSMKLMVGDKLELRWKYDVNVSIRNNLTISLYVNNPGEKVSLLKLKDHGKLEESPKLRSLLPQDAVLELSYNMARVIIPTTIFDDTIGYGINFEQRGSKDEHSTDVTIVDMFLDEAVSSTVLRTWIGQPVNFVCAVITAKNGADSPKFRWKNVDKNITFSHSMLSGTLTESVLTIIPKSDRDFGNYKCYAKTANTKIKHNMTLIKIDYAGFPMLVNFSPRRRSLTWMAPTQEKGEKSLFTIQYLQNRNKCTWIDVNKTSDLSIHLPSLSKYLPNNTARNCAVRVCIDRKKKSSNTSCSQEYRVRDSEVSPPPTVRLANYPSGKATLSWRQQDMDKAEVLEYVIQIFHTAKYGNSKLESIHLDVKKQQKMHIFSLATIKDAVLRVCIRNTLCIYERSCSNKVGLGQVFPSAPRKINLTFYDNSSKVKISWLEPSVRGKGKLSYIVQIWNGSKWKHEEFTSELHTALTLPSLSYHIRVCARNDVEPRNTSCSKSYGDLIPAVPRVVVIASPLPYSQVLSGSTVYFTWKFRIFEEKMIKSISWCYFVSEDNWRDKKKLVQISFKVNASNEISKGPYQVLADKRNRTNCTFHRQNQILTMTCSLSNAKAHDSVLYGVKVEFRSGVAIDVSNTSTLKVVDLILDTSKSDHIVESWVGKPTIIKCAIYRKVILRTEYKWNVVSETKDITRGIKNGGNKTSYTFIPLSKNDFGKYKCTIWTASTKVEHEIVLRQITYAGPPEGLRVDITDRGRTARLFWKQPKKNGGTKIIGYEIIVTGKKTEIKKSTTKISAAVILTDNSRYEIRVCSINKIGTKETSCTTPHEIKIAQLPQIGRQDQLKSHLLQIVGAIIIVLLIV